VDAIATVLRCPSCFAGIPPAQLSSGSTFVCPRGPCAIELAVHEDGTVRALSLRLRNHFSLCILPFSLPENDSGGVARSIRASARWTEQIFSLDSPADADRTASAGYNRRQLMRIARIVEAHAGEFEARWHDYFD